MCKVTHPYAVIGQGSTTTAQCMDLNTARAVATSQHKETGKMQVIYQAVEVTVEEPQPIKFKKVDGVNEN